MFSICFEMNEGQQIPDDLNYIEKGGQAPQGINKEKKKTNEKWHHETFY